MIIQSGSVNTTALVVPDLYVQIVPPQVATLNGVPTNRVGLVGTATWGPKNSPTPFSSYADYERIFGPLQNRTYDMGTQAAAAILQGAQDFRGVRVTDGTDVAATILVQTTCITFTSRWTGSRGNQTQVILSAGSQASTFKATVTMPNQVPEVFDNITGTGNALWVNIAAAINNGQGALRGPSEFIVATAGVGTTAPTLTSYTLASGTDGATTITSAVLIGADTGTRTGLYALRGTGCSVGLLADDSATAGWPTQVAFGLSEGIYMILVGASGETVATAVSNKSTAGIDSYAAKLMLGDWVYWLDTVNAVTRVISPQGFAAGRLANLSPQESGLNKPIYGVAGTQKSSAKQTYSQADLILLGQAGIDVITNPVPGGAYWGLRFGRNTSSNNGTDGDNYTRMTNYIAATINGSLGAFIGQLQSASKRREAASAMSAFFDNMWSQGMIGNADGSVPYQVVISNDNNPPTRVALGYMQADVKVQYLSVIENFIVNVEGGQTVQITRGALSLAA